MEGRSLRDVAPEITIAAPTLSRILNGGVMEMDIFCKIVTWLQIPVQNFFEQETAVFTANAFCRTHYEMFNISIQVSAKSVDEAEEKARDYLKEFLSKESTIDQIVAIPNL